MAVACSREAGEKAGQEAVLEACMAAVEDYIKVEVDKASEEAGAAKGQEVFGDFGAAIGKESGLIAGRKAALEMAKKMVAEIAVSAGSQVGSQAGEQAGTAEAAKYDFKDTSKDCRGLFMEIGAKAAKTACISIVQSVFTHVKMETIVMEARKHSAIAAEKYAIKAREFQKLAIKIAEEAGGAAGEECGEADGAI